MQFSKTSPLKSGESYVAKNPVEKIASNPVTSLAVMVFSALKEGVLGEGSHTLSESPAPRVSNSIGARGGSSLKKEPEITGRVPAGY